jgi:DNA replication licensing factor MCM6
MPNVNKLRELKSLALGRLMSIHGTVTRTTEVKPELMVGSFKCLECNTLSANMEQ